MSELSSVTLGYNGKDYEVAPDRVWGLIEAVEDVITFLELAPCFESGRYPAARLFRAYASALNYAGCKVTPDQVRQASDYRKMGEYAGALGMVLMMAQPGAGLDLGEPTSNPEEPKKKPRSAKRASKSG